MTFRGRGSTELWNKGKWTGRAGREMSQWSKGFFFPPDSGFHVEMPLFSELQALSGMGFPLMMPSILGVWGEFWELEISFSLWLKAPCCVTEFVFGYKCPGYEDTWVGFGHHSLSLRVCPGWAVVMVGEQWNSWAQWSSENKWRV